MFENKSVVLLVFSIVLSTGIVIAAYHKENGIADVIELNGAIAGLENKIALVENRNNRLRGKIKSLHSDDSYTEEIARKELGLVKPGEVVYEFIPADELGRLPSPVKKSR